MQGLSVDRCEWIVKYRDHWKVDKGQMHFSCKRLWNVYEINGTVFTCIQSKLQCMGNILFKCEWSRHLNSLLTPGQRQSHLEGWVVQVDCSVLD